MNKASNDSIDVRLNELDLAKLVEISGQRSLEAPPFYNCFVNRVIDTSVSENQERE